MQEIEGAPLFKDAYPEHYEYFLNEINASIADSGKDDDNITLDEKLSVRNQLMQARVYHRCVCGEPRCATYHTVPDYSGRYQESIDLGCTGFAVFDVDKDGVLIGVERI